jgi:hypothetical protein
MRLDAGADANHNALLDFDKRADEAVIADAALIEVDRLNDLDSCAE